MTIQRSVIKVWLTAVLPVVDFCMLLFGAAVVYFVRYRWFEDNFTGIQQISGIRYGFVSVLWALVTVGVFAGLGLYVIKYRSQWFTTVFKIATGIALTLLAAISFLFFTEYNIDTFPTGVPISRFILGTGGLFALYFVLSGRVVVRVTERCLGYFGIGVKSAVIIGKDKRDVREKITQTPGIKKVYYFKSLSEDNFQEVRELITEREVSELYILEQMDSDNMQLLLQYAERLKISIFMIPPKVGYIFDWQMVYNGSLAMLEHRLSNLEGWKVVLKRLFDIVSSISFFACFWWVYALIALAIKLESPGPVFYPSVRVGPDGRPFKLWKFRRFKKEYCTFEGEAKSKEALEYEAKLIAAQNMKVDDVLYKIQNDPRSTRVGNFIEKYSLDELPQWFNVLIGQISIVGPRPHQPREVAKYKDHHYKVLNIQPGITGLAQVNGRSDLSFEDEVALDSYYIDQWSFWLDLWIIFQTPFVVLFKRHRG